MQNEEKGERCRSIARFTSVYWLSLLHKVDIQVDNSRIKTFTGATANEIYASFSTKFQTRALTF